MLRSPLRFALSHTSRVTVLAVFGTLLSIHEAQAQQTDTNPPLPNVMLLLDTSGSFERMMDGTMPEANATAGNACAAPANSTPNRWGYIVEGLTGTFTHGYSCVAMPRNATGQFFNEYSIGGAAPYDTGYYLPYHRPVSVDGTGLQWVYGPGALPSGTASNGVGQNNQALAAISGGGTINAAGGAFPWATGTIQVRQYGSVPSGSGGASSSWGSFEQNADGALDTYMDLMRLGLMTFDNDPSAALGVTASGVYAPLSGANAFTGSWSYFPGWNNGTPQSASGGPAGCSTTTSWELGAKSPAAPAWEGPLIGFPPPSAPISGANSVEAWNSAIQATINALRPYGATPTAALLSDAMYYFWTDPNGPSVDPQVNCTSNPRKQYMIFITDGVPNDDLRGVGGCGSATSESTTNATSAPTSPCPYHLPETYLSTLYAGTGGAQVTTYVIGFALMTANDGSLAVNCNSLADGTTDGGGPYSLDTMCADAGTTTSLGACCEIQKLALAGSGNQQPAMFVSNLQEFNQAMGMIMSNIAATAATRTVPVSFVSSANPILSSGSNSVNTSGELFYSYAWFQPPDAGVDGAVLTSTDWTGDVQRLRQTCSAGLDASVSVSQGDDFAANLNSGSGTRATRQFLTYLPPTPSGGTLDTTATIRPYISSGVTDGFGTYGSGGTVITGPASNVTNHLSVQALGLTASNPTNCPVSSSGVYLDNTDCMSMVLDFTLGQSFTMPTGYPAFQSRVGSALGQVMHSTPAILPPPSGALEDPTYGEFATNSIFFGSSATSRYPMLYTETNDGLLHGFWTDTPTSSKQNNEIFAFLPPALFPQLIGNYPGNAQYLLDGIPVVKDVVFDRTGAQMGVSTSLSNTQWHSALVSGFGSSQRGYFALDITDPETAHWSSSGGPEFLWQLTTIPGSSGSTTQLFGQYSGTPAITTVEICEGAVSGGADGGVACATPHEVGVAILPGGYNGSPVTPAGGAHGCARATKTVTAEPATTITYPHRSAVNCWGSSGLNTDPVTGRAVTIVRLDTGEILAVFMRSADAPSALTSGVSPSVVINTALDSPMVGVPVVVPNDVGAAAQKFFIGDADGTVWRFDISSSNPQNWSGELFLDLYNTTADTNSSNTSWADGQPIIVAPAQSFDTMGNVVLNVATGGQQSYGSTGTNFVYSVSETLQGTTSPAYLASVNWFQPFTNGEQVTGPMAVFNNVLYYTTLLTTAPSGSVCSNQYSKLWGVDYMTGASSSSITTAIAAGVTPKYGGLAKLVAGPYTLGSQGQCYYPFATGVNCCAGSSCGNSTEHDPVIPGLAIAANLGCTTQGASATDAFGYSYNTYSAPTTGGYAVVWQYSAKNAAGGGGGNGVGVGNGSLSIPTPAGGTAVDSWAAVIE